MCEKRCRGLSRYQSLLGHMQHHNVKKWLLKGAADEDAQTIRNAVKKLDESKLIRRLARALARE